MPDDPTGGAFDFGGSFWEDVADLPVTEDHIYWVSKPKGSDHTRYKSFGTGADDYPEWDNCLVALTGANTSQTELAIEFVYNLECQIDVNSIASSMATNAAPFKPHLTTARGLIMDALGSVMSGGPVASMVKRLGMKYLAQALRIYSPHVLTMMDQYNRAQRRLR
jgi:hypothetical protein